MSTPEDPLISGISQENSEQQESDLALLRDALLRSLEAESSQQFLHSFDSVQEETLPHLGGKAVNLVRLKKAGLPVPNGYCLPTQVHGYYLEHGTLPDGLVEEVLRIKDSLGGKVAIRSSANCEDGTDLSMAGVFQSHYVYDDEEVPIVLQQIYDQSRSAEVDRFMELHEKSSKDVEMGIIVQELIQPETAGVIYTGVNGKNILIQYVDDFGARLVDGETQGSAVLVDEHSRILESSGFETRPLSQDSISQIGKYSRIIEDLFPDFPQDIEFACKDGEVYILQARTLTTELGNVDLVETVEDALEATKKKLRQMVATEKAELGTHTAIFSDANYSELLPKPTEMDIGIHMYVWGGSDGIPGAKQLGHAAMGYIVGDKANEIIKFIGGRTYFSISRNAGVYHIGFPATESEYFSTLVNEYLTTVQEDPERGAYPQMGLYLQDPTFEDLEMRFGERAEEYFQVYQQFIARMRVFADEYLSEFHDQRLPQTRNYIEEIQRVDIDSLTNDQLCAYAIGILEHNRTQSYVDFVKGARLGFYYSQRLQSLLRERLGVGKDEAQKLYSRLNQGLDGSAITEANIAIAESPTEEEAVGVAQELIGHYSTGEMLEIRHQPMRDDPTRLLAYVRGIRETGRYKEDFERQRQGRIVSQEAILARVPEKDREELAAVMRASQTYMAVRETAKYYFTKEYLFLRDALEKLGSRFGLEQGDIYHLYPRELPAFVADPESFLHVIHSRKQSFKNYSKLHMPPIIRETDIDSLGVLEEDTVEFTEAAGKFLAEGEKISGVVVNVDEFASLEQANEVMRNFKEQNIPVILAAVQMNLSHDPLIAQAAGLVIQNAGLVAHGAQRARELGKGAIGGIHTKMLKTGTEVVFDPETRTLTKVGKKDEN